jgi:hypothetical protein
MGTGKQHRRVSEIRFVYRVHFENLKGGGSISSNVFCQKNSAIWGTFSDIGIFGDMGKKYSISFKNEKSVGVRNNVII